MDVKEKIGAPKYIFVLYPRVDTKLPTHFCQQCTHSLGKCVQQNICGRCPRCGDVGSTKCMTCTKYICETCTCSICRSHMCICHLDCRKNAEKPIPIVRSISCHDLAMFRNTELTQTINAMRNMEIVEQEEEQ